jgi:hypothetical protein
MTALLPILLHAALLIAFWLLVRPGICEELDEKYPFERFVGNALFLLLLANVGGFALNVRHLLGF